MTKTKLTKTAIAPWQESDHTRNAKSGEFAAQHFSDPDIGELVPDTNVFTKTYDSESERHAAFTVELEARVDALGTDENWNAYLTSMALFSNYSMGNQMMIAMQCPGATRVAGFKTWQKLGRRVDGQKSIRIWAPAKWTTEIDNADGTPKFDADGKRVTKSGSGFTTVGVFDISQTTGKPLPQASYALTETPPAGFIEDLEQSIREAGFTVNYEAIPGDARGFTDPATNQVAIEQDLGPADRARVLSHELGHIMSGHLERMDEYHTGVAGARSAMEVEAESFAYVVCRANGMSPSVGDRSAPYVAGWAQSDPEAIRLSADRVAVSVKKVLQADHFLARNAERDAAVAAESADELAEETAAWEVQDAIDTAERKAGWAREKAEKAAAKAERIRVAAAK